MHKWIAKQRSQSLVKNLLFALATVVVLTGCSVGPQPMPNDPEYAPVIAHSIKEPKQNPGGIYSGDYSISLYTDRQAARIGDIITVMLNERTASSKSAETSMTKDNEISMNDANILGVTPSLNGYTLETDLNQERDFSGESESDQSNSLDGSIACTVSDILPNGLLVIRGEKWLTLNRGDEFIRVRGIIRQGDINSNNTISSTKVADARITYSGTGDLADANDMGWGARFFNSRYWPF